MATKPSIIMVPGAWHTPKHYDPLLTRLEKAGYDIHRLYMPSAGSNPNPSSAEEDVALIRQTITSLADQGLDVLVLVHSRGGVPGSSAAQGLSKTSRAQAGKPGGIVRMFYMCAFALEEGVSLSQAARRGGEKPWYDVLDDGTIPPPEVKAEKFYSDLPTEVWEAAIQADGGLRTIHQCQFTTACEYAAWRYIPSTYLVCENDRAIRLVAQEAMISQPGAKFTVERCTASHSPFLSMPDFTAEAVRRAAGESIPVGK